MTAGAVEGGIMGMLIWFGVPLCIIVVLIKRSEAKGWEKIQFAFWCCVGVAGLAWLVGFLYTMAGIAVYARTGHLLPGVAD